MADTQSQQPVAPATPASKEERLGDLLNKAFVAEGLAPAPASAPAKTEAPKQAETPAAPPVPPANEPPALVKIAKAQAELRKEREQVEPYLGLLRAFTPQEAQRLAQARASGSAAAALNALGFSHEQYAAELMNAAGAPKTGSATPAEAPKTDSATPGLPPELQKKLEELESFKERAEREELNRTRQAFLSKVSEQVKDTHPLLAKLGEYERVEQVLLAYQQQHRSLPGETIEESIRLAAEVVEADLKAAAEKWKNALGLTAPAEPAPLPSQKAPESPSTGTETTRTLPNAAATAPRRTLSPAEEREERIKRVIATLPQ